MTTGTLRAATTASLAALLVVCGSGSAPTGQTEDRPLVTEAEYERWFDELSNWGRWGPDDEMGALNLITPDRRRAAAGLVTEGFTVSLASIATTERTIDNPCPVEWSMVRAAPGGASDTINYACIHGPGRRISTASPTVSSTAGCGTATRSMSSSRWSTGRRRTPS